MTLVSTTQNLSKAVAYVKNTLWFTGIDIDAELSLCVKAVVATIEKQTKIDLLTMYSDEVIYFNGAWQRKLYIGKTLEVSQIEYNANQRWTADRQDFDSSLWVYNEWVITFASNLYRGTKNIRVTVSSAYDSFDVLPSKYDDLKYAMALMANNLYITRKQAGLRSESVSWTSLVYDKRVLTDDVADILNLYRTIAI